MIRRKYTGTSDGVSRGRRAGLEQFVVEANRVSDGALWNNGTWGVRNMRGKGDLSVHATGRAVDLSYRNMRDGRRGRPNGRKYATRFMDWLVRNADEVGLELIIDYRFGRHGRGWRCDRGEWRTYQKATVSGGGALWADWLHIELSPQVADDAKRMRDLFATFPPNLFEG